MADLPSKGPQTQSAQQGGRKTMTMVIIMMRMMMMMTMMTMMIIMRFLHPKGLKTGLAPRGGDKL